jgi:hypothetical protein
MYTAISFADNSWLQHLMRIPAIEFGINTAGVPFLIMQPAFDLGIAASNTSKPIQAGLRSLMNHSAIPDASR